MLPCPAAATAKQPRHNASFVTVASRPRSVTLRKCSLDIGCTLALCLQLLKIWKDGVHTRGQGWVGMALAWEFSLRSSPDDSNSKPVLRTTVLGRKEGDTEWVIFNHTPAPELVGQVPGFLQRKHGRKGLASDHQRSYDQAGVRTQGCVTSGSHDIAPLSSQHAQMPV